MIPLATVPPPPPKSARTSTDTPIPGDRWRVRGVGIVEVVGVTALGFAGWRVQYTFPPGLKVWEDSAAEWRERLAGALLVRDGARGEGAP